MFSHQTSERFEKERTVTTVGPGSYQLPSTLDSKGIVIEGTERWQDTSTEGMPGPGEYDPKAAEKGTDPAGPANPTAKRQATEKENRAPSSQRKVLQKSASVRNQGPQVSLPMSETTVEAKQRQQDLRLASQLDNVRDELKQKTRENKDLQQQVAAKDRKLEELQKRAEDLTADRREAHRKASDIESELSAKRRQLHEKEQDLLAQQRKNEHLRVAAEERSKRFERKEEEHKTSSSEIQKLRSSVDGLQEKLSASERDRKAADQARQQQEQRGEQLERGFQEHLAVLEESLRREEGRRRELEERAARTGAEREQGETELAAERRRAEDLQARVAQLEAEVKAKLAEQKEQMEKQHRLEDEVSAAKARNTVQGEALTRSEEARQELETRVARAEVAAEARARDLAAESARAAELEEARQRFGEAQYIKQQEKLEEAEGQVRSLTRELEEERERCEDLERRGAELEERERVAVEAAQSAEAQRLEVQRVEGLQQRLERAEANAEEAEAEVRRLKEWADEQTLREITADMQRMEEMKRVREDVDRQVAAARAEVVQENEGLQKRIRSLEAGPEGAAALRERLEEQERQLRAEREALAAAEAERADLESRLESTKKEVTAIKAELGDARGALDEAARQAEEERKALESRIAHAEADASLASDELTEERERLEAQAKALRIQHETAMASHSEETAMSRAAEREAATRREAALEEAFTKTRASGCLSRWRLLTEASLSKHFNAQMEETWGTVRHTAHMWRSMANGHERDGDLLQRQGEELDRLDVESEALRDQNRQVLASMQQAQQELQWSLAETRRLQEREAAYEGELLRMSERSAELAGHSNHKQKIKHLMNLKAENEKLRADLKNTKQQASQLEAQLRTSHFFDSVVAHDSVPSTGGAGGRAQTPRKSSAGHPATTPGRQPPRTPNRGDRDRDPLSALADDRPEAARRERAEALRHARAHRRASERAAVEYQHLASVVEQVLALQPAGASTVVASGTITPERGSNEAGVGAEPGALLRRLRELAAQLSGGGAAARAVPGAKGREQAAPGGGSDADGNQPTEHPFQTPRPEVASTTGQNSPEPEREAFPPSARGERMDEDWQVPPLPAED